MNKKLWTGFIVVLVLWGVMDYLVNGILLQSAYMADEVKNLWRPMGEMKMWIIYVTYFFFAYFFTLIFSKGFENKGIMEGVRYGFYVGMMISVPMAYGTYAVMPIPYSLAIQWFLYGLIESVIAGVALSFIFKPKAENK